MIEIEGFTLPSPDDAAQDFELKSKVSRVLKALFDAKNLTTERANDRLNTVINQHYGFPDRLPVDLRIWRLKVHARLQAANSQYFGGAIILATKYDNYSETPAEDGALENVKTFFGVYGDEFADITAPNVEALRFLSKNAWWIAPLAVGVYLAPTILKMSKGK